MNSPSRPWMKFYPGDWRADPLLRQCEPLSRYLWLEMIGLMHEAEPYGHLVFAGQPMGPAKLARIIAMDLADVETALAELEAMEVFSRDEDGIIFSRRMVRDEEKHRRASKFGKRGARAKLLREKEESTTPKGRPEPSPEGGPEGPHQPRDQRPDSPHVSPKAKGRSSKGPIPDDWEPVEFGAETQSRRIVDGWTALEVERQIERFRAHHRAAGSKYADWQQAWATWVLNSERFASKPQGPAGPRYGGAASGTNFVDLVLSEHEDRKK